MDKLFLTFLIISIVSHTAFLFNAPLRRQNRDTKTFQKIEITYQQVMPAPKKKQIKKHKPPEKAKIAKNINVFKKTRGTPPRFGDYFKKLNTDKNLIRKPTLNTQRPIIAGVKRIRLQELKVDSSLAKSNLPKNPVYLKYYRTIRDKIRRYAYYNYNRAYAGEIYISFLVTSEGSLKALKIIDEKSTSSDYLKEIAVRSIKDSAPFPPIPKELNYPELSFNVIIAFELN